MWDIHIEYAERELSCNTISIKLCQSRVEIHDHEFDGAISPCDLDSPWKSPRMWSVVRL